MIITRYKCDRVIDEPGSLLHWPDSVPRPTAAAIVDEVRRVSGIAHEEWAGNGRQAPLITARTAAALLLRSIRGSSTLEMRGAHTGWRSASSIQTALRNADAKAIAMAQRVMGLLVERQAKLDGEKRRSRKRER